MAREVSSQLATTARSLSILASSLNAALLATASVTSLAMLISYCGWQPRRLADFHSAALDSAVGVSTGDGGRPPWGLIGMAREMGRRA